MNYYQALWFSVNTFTIAGVLCHWAGRQLSTFHFNVRSKWTEFARYAVKARGAYCDQSKHANKLTLHRVAQATQVIFTTDVYFIKTRSSFIWYGKLATFFDITACVHFLIMLIHTALNTVLYVHNATYGTKLSKTQNVNWDWI